MMAVDTFTATIYIGFKERDTGVVHSIEECWVICQEFVNNVGLCVTVTPTEYIYTNGNEPGAAIGLINYPRFPSEPDVILFHAVALGTILLEAFDQYKVSIVCPNKTYMLESETKDHESH